MVYNAMKLFMEINPQLFDDCSQDYNELQNSASSREKARQDKWDRLQEQANKMKNGLGKNGPSTSLSKASYEPDATQDNQKRLDALKLHDESAAATKQTSVSLFHSWTLLSRCNPYPLLSLSQVAKTISYL